MTDLVQKKINLWKNGLDDNGVLDKLLDCRWLDPHFGLINKNFEEIGSKITISSCEHLSNMISSFKERNFDNVLFCYKEIQRIDKCKQNFDSYGLKLHVNYSTEVENEIKKLSKNYVHPLKLDIIFKDSKNFLQTNLNEYTKKIIQFFSEKKKFLENKKEVELKQLKKEVIKKKDVVGKWREVENIKLLANEVSLGRLVDTSHHEITSCMNDYIGFFYFQINFHIQKLKVMVGISEIANQNENEKKKKNKKDKSSKNIPKENVKNSIQTIIISWKKLKKINEKLSFLNLKYLPLEQQKLIGNFVNEIFCDFEKTLKKSQQKHLYKVLKYFSKENLVSNVEDFSEKYDKVIESSGTNKKLEMIRKHFEATEYEKIPDIIEDLNKNNNDIYESSLLKLNKYFNFFSDEISKLITLASLKTEDWEKIKLYLENFELGKRILGKYIQIENVEKRLKKNKDEFNFKINGYLSGLKGEIEKVANLEFRKEKYKILTLIIKTMMDENEKEIDLLNELENEELQRPPEMIQSIIENLFGLSHKDDQYVYNSHQFNAKELNLVLNYYKTFAYYTKITEIVFNLMDIILDYLTKSNCVEQFDKFGNKISLMNDHLDEETVKRMNKKMEESKLQISVYLTTLSQQIVEYIFDNDQVCVDNKVGDIEIIDNIKSIQNQMTNEIFDKILHLIENIEKNAPTELKEITNDYNILSSSFQKLNLIFSSYKHYDFFSQKKIHFESIQRRLAGVDERISKKFEKIQGDISIDFKNNQQNKNLKCQNEIEILKSIGKLKMKKNVGYNKLIGDIEIQINNVVQECEEYLDKRIYPCLEERMNYLKKLQPLVIGLEEDLKVKEKANIDTMISFVKLKLTKELSKIKELFEKKEPELMKNEFEKNKEIISLENFVPGIKHEFSNLLNQMKVVCEHKREKLKEKIDKLFIGKIDRTPSNEIILSDINQDINLFQSVEHCHKLLFVDLDFSAVTTQLLEKYLNIKFTKAKEIMDIPSVANELIDFQFIGSFINLPIISRSIEKIIDFRNSEATDKEFFIYNLGKEIEKDNSSYAFEVVNSYKQFKMISIESFTKKTAHHDYIYAVENIEENSDENGKIKLTGEMQDSLKKSFEIYNATYFGLFEKYIKESENKNEILNQLEQIIIDIERETKFDNLSSKTWELCIVSKVPLILAHIFVIWTFQNSDLEFFNPNGNKDREQLKIMKPHPIQIITIFRLLGVHNLKYVETEKNDGLVSYFKNLWKKTFHSNSVLTRTLDNHLIEIGTGEGKSITLAVTAIVFSILGFEVNVACYSKYLSERDHNDFKNLFHFFDKLTKRNSGSIKYSTIKELCESHLNEQGDLREGVNNLLNGKKIDSLKISKTKRMMLIDEVDVFFSKSFYGNTYNPLLLLSNESIIELIEYIFEQNVDFMKVKESQAYKKASQMFSNYKWLLDTEIQKMLEEKQDFRNPPYVVYQGKIGYQEFDGVSTKISNGYKTQFAYVKEKLNVDKESYKNSLGIRVICGMFSYVEVAKKFDIIMGVTGTLTSLCTVQKEILKNFNIKKFTYAPSMFQKNKIAFSADRDFLIFDNNQELFQKIAINAEEESKKGRAVLIFFENIDVLQKFKNSSYYKPFINQHNELTPLTEYKDKLINIRKATRTRAVTLLTRDFGRGIDFLCLDKQTIDKGGVHVISSFFSWDISEEIQMKGRTGRQEQKGSFSLFIPSSYTNSLNEEDLEVNLKHGRYAQILDQLETIRTNELEKDTIKLMEFTSKVLSSHNTSLELQKSLFVGVQENKQNKNEHNKNNIKYNSGKNNYIDLNNNNNNNSNTNQIKYEDKISLLKVLNPPFTSYYHIVFVLDCSGSMESTVQGINGEERRWDSLVGAVNTFLSTRINNNAGDIVSIIEFDSSAYVQCIAQPLSSNLVNYLRFYGGGTRFSYGLQTAQKVIQETLKKVDYSPILLFLSDGESSVNDGVEEMTNIYKLFEPHGLHVYTLGFCGSDEQLKNLARIAKGKFLSSLNGVELESNFSNIAYEITVGEHK